MKFVESKFANSKMLADNWNTASGNDDPVDDPVEDPTNVDGAEQVEEFTKQQESNEKEHIMENVRSQGASDQPFNTDINTSI